MSDLSNIARPYAHAIFELAEEQNNLAGWGTMVDLLASIARDESLGGVISDPHVSSQQLEELIISVGGDHLNDEAINLVKLLVKNSRVNALPEIASVYAEKRSEAERVVEATMTTATSIDEPEQKQFVDALEARLGRTVKLEFDVDDELLGGAVIRAGDWVVDGSVRAQLEQLVGAIGA
ncbi:MAG: F0F1 ATP synthase subunit delta [Gammaproteobacteria bacterium]|nr:F0F1 ATP synthase subunit delta [Gammaproteobacteria bacterium]